MIDQDPKSTLDLEISGEHEAYTEEIILSNPTLPRQLASIRAMALMIRQERELCQKRNKNGFTENKLQL